MGLTDKKNREEILQLSKDSIQKLIPYSVETSTLHPQSIYLDKNESPFTEESSYTLKNLNRYPAENLEDLHQQYAAYIGVDSENVLATLGGDEAIKLLMEAFCDPIKEEKILYSPPTFGMYGISAQVIGIGAIETPLTPQYDLDLDAIINALNQPQNCIKLIFICHPNNPTGNLMTEEKIRHILELARGKAIVVVDEAYMEFSSLSSEKSRVCLIHEYPHLAIIRTLSKAFGLAGIRCGFTVANRALIEVLKKVIAPFPMPSPVIEIAIEALKEANLAAMAENVTTLLRLKNELVTSLRELACVNTIYPSDANFILVEVNNSEAIYNHLLANRIYVRQLGGALENMLRITVGSTIENRALLNILNAYSSRMD